MGFGTNQQMGNRQPEGMPGTSLADIFRGNIGAPQPVGTLQRPPQLFELIQQLLGGQQPPAAGGTGTNQTPLSSVTANAVQTPTNIFSQMNSPMGTSLNRISNPIGPLINQRFIR